MGLLGERAREGRSRGCAVYQGAGVEAGHRGERLLVALERN